jgi:ABC-type phosphate/phosphonate transport system substrate-binding protein
MEFAGSHEEAIKRLVEGKVDLAAVYAGAAHDETLAVYATTLAMPNEPFFVRNGLAPQLDAALVKGLQAWASDAANQPLAQRLTALTGLVPTEDAPYRATYQTLRGAGRFVEDLVPGGRALVWSNLSSAWAP